MTRDEIQRLMGSYATGSLSEAERKLLYDAALEDQDLFDQLAHEHALKELIDEPGGRDRLIASLASPETAVNAAGGWKRPLAWGLSVTFVVSMSVAAVMLTRSSIRTQMAQQTAQLEAPAQPASPATASPVTVSPPPTPAASPVISAPPPPVQPAAKNPEARTEPLVVDKKKVQEADAKEASAEKLDKFERSRKDEAPKASAPAAPAAAPPPAQTAQQVQVIAQAPLPPPVQQQGFVVNDAQNSRSQQNSPAPGGPAQNGRANTQSGVGGGGRGGFAGSSPAPQAPALRRQAAKTAPVRFAFDYALEGEDLVFKFAAVGYFSLHIAPGGLTIVDAHVTAGSTRRERVNSNGTEAVIVFSAAPQSGDGGIKLTSTLKSDTIEDPSGQRIEVLVRFYPPPH